MEVQNIHVELKAGGFKLGERKMWDRCRWRATGGTSVKGARSQLKVLLALLRCVALRCAALLWDEFMSNHNHLSHVPSPVDQAGTVLYWGDGRPYLYRVPLGANIYPLELIDGKIPP